MPSPTGLVVKKGSKIFCCISAGMPAPVSQISTRTQPSSRDRAYGQRPALGHRIEALSIRLVHTWFSSAGCAGTVGSESIEVLDDIDASFFDLVAEHDQGALQSVVDIDVWCAARSICEYCLAAATSVEIRSVESSISPMSCSISSA